MNRYHEQPGLDFGFVLRGIMLVLIAAWLTGCNGSDRDAAVVIPTPSDGGTVFPGVPGTCPADDGSAVDALVACGGPDVICVGYFDGTSVGNLAPLTTGGWPAWSPDGQQLAFVRTSEDFVTGIHLINADGTGERWLVEGWSPSWSPDGGRIAFTSNEGISVINVDGTGFNTIRQHGTVSRGNSYLVAPAWSPDGQRIAFVDETDLHDTFLFPTVHVMNQDGRGPTQLTRLTSRAGSEGPPAWSPSGDRIAFGMTDGRGDLKVVNATGGKPTVLVSDQSEHYSRPAWSPEGSILAYTSNRVCGPSPTIRTVLLDGEPLHTLVRHARQPAWSPDSTRMAFVTAGADGSPREFRPVSGAAEIYVRESPDTLDSLSRYVLYGDDRFELQYLSHSWGPFSYQGDYSRDGAELTFDFDGSSVAGPWQATGTLDGDRLTIRYNLIMILSDFEDGVYVLSGG
jgi:dipeptidyl aminopeptidase/acylaminoacyl peptidase